MSALWSDIKNAYFSYNGMGINLFFWFIAVIYILIQNKKEQRNLLIYELLCMLIMITPMISNRLIQTAGGEVAEGWMVFCILNTAVLAVYVGTEYFFCISEKSEKIFVIFMYLVLLQAGMSLNYTADHFTVMTNMYKISSETIQIAEDIDFIENPRILAPVQVGSELREYDTKYAFISGEGLSYTQENIEQLQVEIAAYGCNCVVLNTEYDNQEALNNIGFSRVGNTEHYVVYAK